MDPSEVGPDQTRPNPDQLVSDPIGPDPIKKTIKVATSKLVWDSDSVTDSN